MAGVSLLLWRTGIMAGVSLILWRAGIMGGIGEERSGEKIFGNLWGWCQRRRGGLWRFSASQSGMSLGRLDQGTSGEEKMCRQPTKFLKSMASVVTLITELEIFFFLPTNECFVGHRGAVLYF